VLAIEPNNLSAIDGLGSILSNMAATPYDREKFEESKRYHKRHIELSPNDADPYYWIGFINWTIAYRANEALRREYNKTSIHPIKGDEPLPPSVRANFAATHGSLVDEGIACLDKATALEQDHASAFAYLNLLYRQKADMTDSFQQRKALLDYADALVETYKQIKQKQLEKAAREPPPSLR
jgi:tetratricopeptide (TPR) repeat protein